MCSLYRLVIHLTIVAQNNAVQQEMHLHLAPLVLGVLEHVQLELQVDQLHARERVRVLANYLVVIALLNAETLNTFIQTVNLTFQKKNGQLLLADSARCPCANAFLCSE